MSQEERAIRELAKLIARLAMRRKLPPKPRPQ
jgi:hypothetical protein